MVQRNFQAILGGLLLSILGLQLWTAVTLDSRQSRDHAILLNGIVEARDVLRQDHALLESWYQPMQDSLNNLTRQQDALANQLFEQGFPGQRELEANLQAAVAKLGRDHYLLETWYPGFVTKLDALLAQCPVK